MAEPTQPKTLSELKKQLLSQPAQTTSVRPKTLSELKAQTSDQPAQPGISKPKTLSELKAQTFKGVEEGKVGAIKIICKNL
jgi:hypothetical protein